MLSRREALWMSVLASHPLLSRKGLRARYPRSFWDDPKSPPTTPFVRPLPFPLPPRVSAPFPVMKDGQALGTRLRSRRTRVDGQPELPSIYGASTYHRLVEEEILAELHPDLPLTPVWRYRDAEIPAGAHGDGSGLFVPGPTIIARARTPIILRVTNQLPENHVGFGVNHTTTHHHGGHNEARSDGFPEQGMAPNPTFDPISRPGESYDYCYAMQDPGFSHGEPDPDERGATEWYHDHLLDFTGPNVYRGLAGFLLVYDEVDAGDENLITPENLRLPSLFRPDGSLPGFDIPLVLSDKVIAPDGSLVYLPEDFDGFIGDKRLVNGRIDPFLEVERRKYRFRILIGSNARIWGIRLVTSGGHVEPFTTIGNDGGLYAAPLRNRTFTGLISPAERRDIVIDFSQYPAGTRLYLEDIVDQDDGRGPGGDFDDPDLLDPGEGKRFLEFRVVPATGPDNSRVPDVLRPFAPVPQHEIDAARRREVVFERGNGAWQINDEFVDLDNPCFEVPLNRPEIWKLKNNGGGWWHPIHVHLEFMRVLKRNGALPPLDERDGFAKTDTVLLGPNDEVEAFLKFRDFPGPFVFHCHNLEHEDHFMMCRFDVVEEG